MARYPENTPLTEFLSDLCVAVVAAIQTRDQRSIEHLTDQLQDLAIGAVAENELELADFFQVLRGLLGAEDMTREAARLVGPFRKAYERILQALEEEESGEMSIAEWIAVVTSAVVTTIKRGSAEDRIQLEQELAAMAGQVRLEERGFHTFIEALRALLRGEDTRRLVIRLQPPYREAYLSMLQLLRAGDPGDFALRGIIDRIRHNTVVALTQGGREARTAVAEALGELEDHVPGEDATARHLAPFLAGARALLLGEEPPAAVSELPEPFADAWADMLAARSQGST